MTDLTFYWLVATCCMFILLLFLTSDTKHTAGKLVLITAGSFMWPLAIIYLAIEAIPGAPKI